MWEKQSRFETLWNFIICFSKLIWVRGCYSYFSVISNTHEIANTYYYFILVFANNKYKDSSEMSPNTHVYTCVTINNNITINRQTVHCIGALPYNIIYPCTRWYLFGKPTEPSSATVVCIYRETSINRNGGSGSYTTHSVANSTRKLQGTSGVKEEV